MLRVKPHAFFLVWHSHIVRVPQIVRTRKLIVLGAAAQLFQRGSIMDILLGITSSENAGHIVMSVLQGN